jgi:hypothetical protein
MQACVAERMGVLGNKIARSLDPRDVVIAQLAVRQSVSPKALIKQRQKRYCPTTASDYRVEHVLVNSMFGYVNVYYRHSAHNSTS